MAICKINPNPPSAAGYHIAAMNKDGLEARGNRVNHTYENGRRYHGFKAEFPFPNDEESQGHFEHLRTLWERILDNELFSAPIILPLLKNSNVLLGHDLIDIDWSLG